MLNTLKNLFKNLFNKNKTTLCANKSCSNDQNLIVNDKNHPVILLKSVIVNDQSQYEITRKAIELCNRVYATEYFKNKILLSQCTETNGLQSQALFDYITRYVTEVNVVFFFGSFRQNYFYHTVGYDIGDGTTYVNSYFVKDHITLGSLITHEAIGHGKGFTHYGNKDTSFPYFLNKAFEDTCAYLGVHD